MSRLSTPRAMSFDPRSAGPATKALCLITLVASVVCQLTQQRMGIGILTFVYDISEVLHLQLWRLVTYPFIYTNGFGLVLGVLILFLFGASFESSYGTRDFVRFFALSSIGAAVLAIPIHMVLETVAVFQDVTFGVGSGPAVDAMLMALALTSPNSNIFMGFLLPMRARTAIIGFLVIKLLFGVMDGSASLSMSLGGLAMGYLLVTGRWRPSRWVSGLGRRNRPRIRNGLYIVPPKHDDTLH